ncbi:uncharacterized protein ACR2FA_011923 [Aphomia sociella]
MMENDPNKKESKGKRIFKKVLRRNSKSNNSSQKSTLDSGIAVSLSKSFENKRLPLELNDSTPLPTPDGTKEKPEYSNVAQEIIEEKVKSQELDKTGPSDEVKVRKVVEIHENHNEIYDEPAGVSKRDAKLKTSSRIENNDRPIEADNGKKSLKRVRFLLRV